MHLPQFTANFMERTDDKPLDVGDMSNLGLPIPKRRTATLGKLRTATTLTSTSLTATVS